MNNFEDNIKLLHTDPDKTQDLKTYFKELSENTRKNLANGVYNNASKVYLRLTDPKYEFMFNVDERNEFGIKRYIISTAVNLFLQQYLIQIKENIPSPTDILEKKRKIKDVTKKVREFNKTRFMYHDEYFF
jgi:hypothetical protein